MTIGCPDCHSEEDNHEKLFDHIVDEHYDGNEDYFRGKTVGWLQSMTVSEMFGYMSEEMNE